MHRNGLSYAGGLAAALGVLGAGPVYAAGPYDEYDRGVYLTYAGATASSQIAAPPHLRISFGGRGYRAVMDTGSTGVVVSADKFPDIDSLPTLGPGRFVYSSSGRIMQGRWVVTPLTIAGGNGASLVTAPIPVLAVERVTCTARARNCVGRDAPRGIAMLGIGFGRRADGQQQSGPDKNPFLHVARIIHADGKSMDAEGVRRGYIVTRRGVHVGLTGANADGGFGYVRLKRAEDGADWQQVPACITVARAAPACGSLLMDTGVTAMFLTVPDAPVVGAPGRLTLRRATTIAVSVPSAQAPQASYAFTLGDRRNALAPSGVHFIRRERTPFVNTGVHFLNGFDYLFDADDGIAGFRWSGRRDRPPGMVRPSGGVLPD